MQPNLQQTIQWLEQLPQHERDQLTQLVENSTLSIWSPNPGPQVQAYVSRADELFYGGAAGGGKTGLIAGLALTQHQRTLIIRRESTQMRGLIDDLARLLKTRDGLNKQDGQWRIPAAKALKEDQLIEFGGVPNPGDEERHQGIPHDLLAFDEVSQLSERVVDYLTTWNRTTTRGQRCRIVLTSNPPMPGTDDAKGLTGLWLVRRYAPWLDPQYRDAYRLGPAQPGELRWFVTLDGVEQEWPDCLPFYHVVQSGPRAGQKELVIPKSRTFIPALPTDNPYLGENYIATLQKLPEPMRSALLYGDFSVSLSDRPLQLIPTEWLRAANARWERLQTAPVAPDSQVMTALAVDVSRGGGDSTTLQARHGSYFSKPVTVPSVQTLNGASVAGQVVGHRRDQATVIVDANGVGASVYDHLRNNTSLGDQGGGLIGYVGSKGSLSRDTSGVYGFPNKRSEVYWKLREALDPASNAQLAIPPDPELTEELLVLTWKEMSGKIQVLPKEKVIELLKRSPDKADALVMAHSVYDPESDAASAATTRREKRLAEARVHNSYVRQQAVSWGTRASELPYTSWDEL